MKSEGRGVRFWILSPATAACLVLAAVAAPLLAQSTRLPTFQLPDSSTGGQQSPDQPSPNQQAPGTISGTVIDQSGAVVVDAQVTLTRPGQAEVREIRSGDDGQFSFADVAPGAFQIKITAPSFVPQTSSEVLRPGQFLILPPVKLQLAGVSTEVQVTPASTEEIAQQQIKAQEKQRVLAVVPNYYVTYVPNAAPLNPRQKFELAWKTMIDPVTFALAGAVAGVQQAQNDFSGYGQGAEGYAKRFGAAYADDATSTFIGSALLPTLFKQDPRYFYKGTGSTGSRLLYAVAMSVVCKGDNGHWQPQYSAILGGLASGAISNLYYPPKDRGAGLVFENTAIGTAETAVFNVLQEFLLRRLTPHAPKNKPSKQPNPTQP